MLLNNENFKYEHYVELYHQTESNMERARIIKTIREYFKLPFKKLSDDLFEVERTIYRIYQLNKLIPEFQEMLEEGEIRMRKASLIANLEPEVQYAIYRKHRENQIILKVDHQYFLNSLMEFKKIQKNTN
jgi:hypothetical protein